MELGAVMVQVLVQIHYVVVQHMEGCGSLI